MTAQNRLFAACVLSSFLGGAAMFGALHFSLDAHAEDKKPEKVLKAQRFEIVNAKDEVIGHLGTNEGKEIGLYFLGDGGNATMALTINNLILTNGVNGVTLGPDKVGGKQRIEITNGKEVWTQP
jgi:hypothetical protein